MTEEKKHFIQLLEDYWVSGKKVIINGMDKKGKITAMHEDYIDVEYSNNAKEQKDVKTELVHIPLTQIFTVGEGMKKSSTIDAFEEKPKEEKK